MFCNKAVDFGTEDRTLFYLIGWECACLLYQEFCCQIFQLWKLDRFNRFFDLFLVEVEDQTRSDQNSAEISAPTPKWLTQKPEHSEIPSKAFLTISKRIQLQYIFSDLYLFIVNHSCFIQRHKNSLDSHLNLRKRWTQRMLV